MNGQQDVGYPLPQAGPGGVYPLPPHLAGGFVGAIANGLAAVPAVGAPVAAAAPPFGQGVVPRLVDPVIGGGGLAGAAPGVDVAPPVGVGPVGVEHLGAVDEGESKF